MSFTAGLYTPIKGAEGYRTTDALDYAIVNDEKITVALVWGGWSQGEENAILLASAPELLTTLEETVMELRFYSSPIAKEEAIKKAEQLIQRIRNPQPIKRGE